jgi:hypothetical protein
MRYNSSMDTMKTSRMTLYLVIALIAAVIAYAVLVR